MPNKQESLRQQDEAKENIIKILTKYGTMAAKQMSDFIRRELNYEISPQSISGKMRALVACGMMVSSKDINNHTVYWINKHYKFQ